MIAAASEPALVDPRAVWDSLERRDARGESYLESRGLWPEVLLEADAVRYMRSGAPAVALRHLDVGAAVVNVVRRNLPADVDQGRPKVIGLRGCPTLGALVGDVDEISAGRDAIVCEGVVDSLAAILAWPFAVVCGAHGAGRLAELAAEVAARVRTAGTVLRLVCDGDVTGVRAGAAACRASLAAGLRLGEDLDVVDLGGAHDLASAWKDGWRP